VNSRPRKLARLARALAEEVDAPAAVADVQRLIGVQAMRRALQAAARALKAIPRTLKIALFSLKRMPLTFAKWIGGLLAVASVLFATFQYLDGRWKSRIERSLHLVLTYQDEARVKARNQIDLDDDPMNSIDAIYMVRCRDAIHHFVNDRVGPERKGRYNGMGLEFEIVYDEPGVVAKKILDLSDGEGINTEWGSVASIEGSLWWLEKGTTYHYSWPDMIWMFFNSSERREECEYFLDLYEESAVRESFIDNLHALKHFYATVSICATSGVCDSFVACEAFYREVGTFVGKWQPYFELWSAKEHNSEYDRLHAFLRHCGSNQEFIRYSHHEEVIPEILYIQQFTNYCWQTDGEDSGVCGWLRSLAMIFKESDPEVTLTVQHFVEPEAAAHEKFIEPWARRIEEQSDGRIEVAIYPEMALGGAPWELYSQVRDGDADIVWTLIGYTPDEFSRSQVFELPTVHRGSALATTLAIQDVFEQIAPDYADVHPLLIHVHAGQAIHMIDKPIRSVDDLAGLKIRIPSHTGKMLIEAWNADPVEMPIPELPQALRAGLVDGALAPYEIVPPYRIHELTKQSVEGPDGGRFGTSVFAFLMNKKTYEALPDDLRVVIDANSGAAIAGEIGKIWDEVEEPARAATNSGREIISLDHKAIAEFDERSERVTERWLENMKAKGIPGAEALLDAATDAVERHSRSN
jgi:TRAP-type C4-dicarboxylate transport system substrate-binding protein